MLNINEPNTCSDVTSTKVYIQDNVLDQERYLKLLETFPYDDMQRKDIHNKVAFNDYNADAANEFLSSNIEWKDFVDYFFTDDFIDLLNYRFPKVNSISSYSRDDLHIGYEFSILKDGARVVPHKDKYGKLFSFVFYFVPEDWSDKNSYGGTQFYKPKNKLLNLKIFNDSADFESMDLIKEVEPTYNRLMIFEPNETSWHGVAPIKTNDSFGRPAFIVTIHRKRLTGLESFYNYISRFTAQVQKFIN